MKLIQSRDNAFFKQLKKLAESGRERRKAGQTVLDGVHLVEAYEKAFGRLDTLVVAESALTGGEVADYAAGRDVVALSDALMRDLGLVDTPSGLLAVAPIPATAEPPIWQSMPFCSTACRIPAMSARCCGRPLQPVSGRRCCRPVVLRLGRRRC